MAARKRWASQVGPEVPYIKHVGLTQKRERGGCPLRSLVTLQVGCVRSGQIHWYTHLLALRGDNAVERDRGKGQAKRRANLLCSNVTSHIIKGWAR